MLKKPKKFSKRVIKITILMETGGKLLGAGGWGGGGGGVDQ